jgi:UDP-glucose 4-epimerase
MKILVTGGAGYIGSHTVQKLLNAGYEVVVYDNISTGFIEAVPKGADLVIGNILDRPHLARILEEKKISAVVHFAAKLVVPESLEQPLAYYENNTMGVCSLAHACVSSGVKKIIFSSTAAVYGETVGSGLINESSPTLPLSPYGRSKLMSEQILRDADIAHGLKSICLRYFNVAGASLDGKNGQRTLNATHLIKVACEAACGTRRSVEIYGVDYGTPDGTGVRDYIHVEDLADLHVLSLDYLKDGGISQILNCGYGRGFSVLEVINAIKNVSGVSFAVEQKKRRIGDAAHLVSDPTKVQKLFGWKPQHNDLEVICRSAYRWEMKLK